MKELSPEPLPRDHLTIWVVAQQWVCPFCTQGGEGAYTTVDWLGRFAEGPSGRCRTCGIKLRLARMGERVPTPEEQGAS